MSQALKPHPDLVQCRARIQGVVDNRAQACEIANGLTDDEVERILKAGDDKVEAVVAGLEAARKKAAAAEVKKKAAADKKAAENS